ncbi:hypothetical protein ACIBEJ_34300 [Nonomuraea sp. NPDC050790]|uniref:hypothetical protein n=1 Tax=Nonomuraea sp. NPDC050790 TaxID=3364371 RepID=UPI0037956B77
MVDVRIQGAEQLGELAKRLKAAGNDGKKLRKELLKSIRAGAKPALADTRRVVKTIPVVGARGGGRKAREGHQFDRSKGDEGKRRDRARRGAGLRDTVARSLRLVVKTGSRTPLVRIEVDASKLPEDQRTLPRHLDSKRGWRHPTFGREPWVDQRGRPWFAVTIRKHLPAMRTRVITAMNDIAKKVEG